MLDFKLEKKLSVAYLGIRKCIKIGMFHMIAQSSS